MKFSFFRNIRNKKYNTIIIGKSCKIKLDIFGKNNIIRIPKSTTVKGIVIIRGNNCVLEFGDNCSFLNSYICLENNNSRIVIGNECRFMGYVELVSMDGRSIYIGDDLLGSRNIYISNGDGHSVLDMFGKRINVSRDVFVGNHVWIGKNVNILKNGSLGSNSIVGACAVVNKDFSKYNNVIIAGQPASIVKKNIDWQFKRI